MVNERQAIVESVDRGSPERRPPIVITTMDRERLLALLNTASIKDSSAGSFLREELDRADIVSSNIASTSLVTMGCEVKFIDHESERIRHIRLVYPDEANNDRCTSVLSTIGSALIGLGPGQSIRWTEQERERRLTVLEVQAG
jgi:regulator of nucleoside diphosphate kinase